ncbi:MAG: hypothetical protein HY823_15450 [Acidobacteria bacterium]|nr:hypothetical protein [Acidobacteriota bacterium]
MLHRIPIHSMLLVAGVLAAQAPKPAPAKAPATEVPEAQAQPAAPDLLVTKATPYRPGITRDPFLLPNEDQSSKQGDFVDDIGVKGFTRKNGRYFAVVSDKRGSIRELPVGYKFRDGEIASIDDKGVTFRQWDVNSTVRTAFRTVVKSFKREEGKR